MATPPNRTVLVIDHDSTFAQFESHVAVKSGDLHEAAKSISRYFKRLSEGATFGAGAQVNVMEGAVCASGVLTMTGNPTAAQTVTVAGQPFTAVSSNPVANQFLIAGGLPATAQNLVNAVNANSTLPASAALVASGTVNFFAEVPGIIGNNLTLTTNMSNASVLSGNFTGGTNGQGYLYSYGKGF